MRFSQGRVFGNGWVEGPLSQSRCASEAQRHEAQRVQIMTAMLRGCWNEGRAGRGNRGRVDLPNRLYDMVAVFGQGLADLPRVSRGVGSSAVVLGTTSDGWGRGRAREWICMRMRGCNRSDYALGRAVCRCDAGRARQCARQCADVCCCYASTAGRASREQGDGALSRSRSLSRPGPRQVRRAQDGGGGGRMKRKRGRDNVTETSRGGGWAEEK